MYDESTLFCLQGIVIANLNQPLNNIIKRIHIVVKNYDTPLLYFEQERVHFFFFRPKGGVFHRFNVAQK
jgi:hypothetical protein